jgi:formate dehydrogenase assembly factor FdhD
VSITTSSKREKSLFTTSERKRDNSVRSVCGVCERETKREYARVNIVYERLAAR